MKKPKEWEEKFREKFCDEYGYVIAAELSTANLKAFIQQQIDLAIAQRDKELVEAVGELPTYQYLGDTLPTTKVKICVRREAVINLIQSHE
jgi:hypothetical protein